MTDPTDESTPNAAPRALWWFRVLCGLCVVLGLAALVIGILGLAGEPAADATMSAEEFYTGARTLTAIGGLLTILFGTAPFLPRTRMTWGVHLFLITIAMFFVLPMLIAIPLAIAWFGDAVRLRYGFEE